MDAVRELKQLKMRVPEVEFMLQGHTACAGCGSALSVRLATKVLGPQVIVAVAPSCSSALCASLKVPVTMSLFEACAAWASGIKAGLDILGDKQTTVLAWSGDGGTFDIGLQSLSAAAERNDGFVYVCNDNEAYMMTGNQRSSATPKGAWTTTTVQGKFAPKKEIDEIMIAHGIPYLATATVAYPDDYMQKLRKAKSIKGTKFLHILSPCPTGWGFPPDLTLDISRMAVESGVFPLYEVEGGRYILRHPQRRIPVSAYVKKQGRFRNLTDEDIMLIQREAESRWEQLVAKASTASG